MSRLLIDTEPLQVIPELAVQIGLNEALVLQQLHYWLTKSTHKHDGRIWVYNTFTEWHTQFPFWSERTLQRIIANLSKQKLITIKKLNEHAYDRTNWYSINYTALEAYENRSVEIWASAVEKRRTIATERRNRLRHRYLTDSVKLA